MDWSRLNEALAACPIVPVLSVPNIDQAAPLAKALFDGGITVSEVTLRTDAGLAAITQFRDTCPDMVTGAGTVLDVEGFSAAVEAGSEFIVTPGLSAELRSVAATSSVPVIPGIATPSEAMALRASGLRRAKLFPAEVVGGAGMIKALGGPLADMSFMPTGGVTPAKVETYLNLTNVFGVGGTWLVKPNDLADGNWDAITARARDACQLARDLRP